MGGDGYRRENQHSLFDGLVIKSKRDGGAKDESWMSIMSNWVKLLTKVRNTKRGSDIGEKA